MPFIASPGNDSTCSKVMPTLNGVQLFTAGPFYGQYGTGITLANSNTETSLCFNQAAATANTRSAPAASAAVSPINLSSDPTGTNIMASLQLPGVSQLNVPTAPYGALSLGTIFNGAFYGVIGITATPTLAIKILLRNPTTGAVAYTLISTTTTFSPVAGGLLIEPNFCVTSVGQTGTITATCQFQAGTYGCIFTPTVTTVDTRQSYILDLTATWSAASPSNTLTIYYGGFETIV